MAEAIRDGLRLEAIAADIAGDGDTALELLSINAYDIAVLDRDIPGPSGDEVADRIVASGERHADPDAHRGRPARRQGVRVRARGRRLSHQAVRAARARAPAPRPRPAARPPPAAGAGDRRPAARPVPARGLSRRPLRRADQEAVRGPRGARGGRRWRGQRRGAPGTGVGRERRPLHQRRPHHGLGPAQTARRTLADRHRARASATGSTPHQTAARHERGERREAARTERSAQAHPQLRGVPDGRRGRAARRRLAVPAALRARGDLPSRDARRPAGDVRAQQVRPGARLRAEGRRGDGGPAGVRPRWADGSWPAGCWPR